MTLYGGTCTCVTLVLILIIVFEENVPGIQY